MVYHMPGWGPKIYGLATELSAELIKTESKNVPFLP
jgi:hypothetical protein